MSEQASSSMAMIDARRHRAESFTVMILQEIDDLVPAESKEQVYRRIMLMMHDNGFAWTNDEERAAMGLEPRDWFGWTPSERQEMHRREQELMLALQSPGYFVATQKGDDSNGQP